MNSKAFSFGVFVCFILVIGDALCQKTVECYECFGSFSGCPELNTQSAESNYTKRSCDTLACVKYVEEKAAGASVTRRCLKAEEVNTLQNFHGCREELKRLAGKKDPVKTNTCVCHNDLCNVAPRITAGGALSTVLILSSSVMLLIGGVQMF